MSWRGVGSQLEQGQFPGMLGSWTALIYKSLLSTLDRTPTPTPAGTSLVMEHLDLTYVVSKEQL